MQKKVLCVLSGILLLTMLSAVACKPGESAPTTTKPPTQTTATTKPPTATTAPSEKPQYGGTLNIIATTNIEIFGAAVSNRGASDVFQLEQITHIDRTIGPAGSGKVNYTYGPTAMSDVIGLLAESWSTPTTDTWVLDIRKGVRYALNPDNAASKLVNGREMTAEDVAFSIEFLRDTPTSWVNVAEPTLIRNATVQRTGPWQITVKTPVSPNTAYLWIMGGGGSQFVWPKEMLQRYGTSNEWRDQVGTGPFILKDWVSGSVASLVKNPNYWMTNPVGLGKGDKLPYLDKVKYFIIPDLSTQIAAMRSGKADWPIGTMTWDDGQTLLRTNPNMKFVNVISDPIQVGMRRDKADKPYKDIRVRHALMLATDQPSILKTLYSGQGEILDSPARKLYPTVYTPLEQLPESTRELYGYNPEKAKALLTEAGYPNGFKAQMIIQSTTLNQDMAEIIKAQWAKVNVDVEIQPREPGVFMSIWSPRNFDDLLLTSLCGGNAALFVRYSFGYFRGPNSFNISRVNDPIGTDPVVEAAFKAQEKVINADFAACDKLMKDLIPYLLQNAFLIPMPAPNVYRMWQPWLKNYYGEGATKYWIQYCWIDQALKSKITGQ